MWLVYQALVDNGDPAGLPPGVVQHDGNDLPAETLTYLLPSRYCPSDQFGRFVQREFGQTTGGERVLAILAWILEPIDYAPGVSATETTGARTFLERAGVCPFPIPILPPPPPSTVSLLFSVFDF